MATDEGNVHLDFDEPLLRGEFEDVIVPPEFSEDSLAILFSDKHGPELRYTAMWGRWLRWDGSRWAEDDTLAVFDLTRARCREIAAQLEIDQHKLARKLTSAQTVAAVERLARSDRRHAATVQQWDRNEWLLNTPAGTVELHTGELRPARREDYCTKATTVSPAGDSKSTKWAAFLDRVTAGDLELQAFLQRMAGYALTGSTREQALFFLYGTGANGKSLFIKTLAEILGSYARTASMDSFTVTKSEQHPTDLAGLCGARLVTAIETEQGKRWSEPKIKALTGGDKISARFMRQDFFEYVPQFKLIIAGNHKPALRTVDEAIRRRLYLVPFTVRIPTDEQDKELFDKLRTEWPQILRWAIDGCLLWQRDGLTPPKRVREATEEYLAAEDAVGRWLEECALMGHQYSSSSSALWNNWKDWAQTNNEFQGAQRTFSQALLDRGFKTDHRRTGSYFVGLALKCALGV